MSKPNKGITKVFEGFNKLINDLLLHGKYYEVKEINIKFMLTLADHLEHKVATIMEGRNLYKLTLETMYGILKTYELTLFQKKYV